MSPDIMFASLGNTSVMFEPEAFGNKMLEPCDFSSSSVVCFSKWFLVGKKPSLA